MAHSHTREMDLDPCPENGYSRDGNSSFLQSYAQCEYFLHSATVNRDQSGGNPSR